MEFDKVEYLKKIFKLGTVKLQDGTYLMVHNYFDIELDDYEPIYLPVSKQYTYTLKDTKYGKRWLINYTSDDGKKHDLWLQSWALQKVYTINDGMLQDSEKLLYAGIVIVGSIGKITEINAYHGKNINHYLSKLIFK